MNTSATKSPYRQHGLDVEGNLRIYISDTERLLLKLDDKMSVLPSGHSSCPRDIARRLYDAKDEVVRDLKLRLSTLYTYSGAVKVEIERCRRNCSILSAHGHEIHMNTVKFLYENAGSSQASELRRAMLQYNQIVQIIPRIERALALAEARKFTGSGPHEPNPIERQIGVETTPIVHSPDPEARPGRSSRPTSAPQKRQVLEPHIERLVQWDVADTCKRSPLVRKRVGK